MSPRERRTMLLAAAMLLVASLVRFGWELRRGPPLLPPDSAGIRDELLAETRKARAEEELRSRPLAEGERIDPNRAGEVELDRLPGVGPAVAGRIVRERKEGGPFFGSADLQRVRGIGEATAARLAPHLDFDRAPPVSTGRAGSAPSRRSPTATDDTNVRPLTAPAPAASSGASERSADRGATPSTGAADASAVPAPARVDLNRATAAELQTLRGIGPALAERILAFRRDRGGFRSVDELLEVRGIGERTLERLRPRVRVGR